MSVTFQIYILYLSYIYIWRFAKELDFVDLQFTDNRNVDIKIVDMYINVEITN
jgi:hypothetical protein